MDDILVVVVVAVVFIFFFFPFFLSFWAQLCMEFLLNTINRDNHTLYLVLHLPYFLGGSGSY